MQILLVGLGKVGMAYDLNAPANQILTHARAIKSWSKNSNTEINVVGVDINKETKNPFYGIFESGEWFSSIKSLEAKRSFDLAVIATPISSIAQDTSELCSRLEVHKFVVEKPAASNMMELQKLQALPNSDTNFIVGFPRPSLASSIQLKKLIETFDNSEEWQVDIYYAGSVLNILSHFLNLVEFLIEPFALNSYFYNKDGYLSAKFSSLSGRLLVRTHQYGNMNDEQNRVHIEGPISISYTQSGRAIEVLSKSSTIKHDLIGNKFEHEISSMIGNFGSKYMSWVTKNEDNFFTRLNSASLTETMRLAEATNA